MIKLLIGGSPCTYWSICQKNGRETTAEGIGWELFKNYLIARKKFKPDFFLYENNKSADEAIKMQIRHEFGVTDPYQPDFFTPETGVRYVEINSALVSAQNRERFYVHNCGEVGQPKDRGILLKDILENGDADQEKAYCKKHQVGNLRDHFKKHHTNIAAEKVCDIPRPNGEPSNSQEHLVFSIDGKSVCLQANGGGGGVNTGVYAVPVNATPDGKSQTIRQKSQYSAMLAISKAGTAYGATGVAEPVEMEKYTDKLDRICDKQGEIQTGINLYNEQNLSDKAPCQSKGSQVTSSCAAVVPQKAKATIQDRVYKVENGMVEIKGKQYPIKLEDGYYMFRPLTVKEVSRLQTMPDDYCRAVSKSAAFRCLGNGWTAEVIIHILSHALGKVPRDEEIVVLSMYDGIATGRYCLDKMGFTNVRYYAYEIDKYAMQVALSNYPDIIECGDAFQLRDDDWRLPE